MKNWLIGALAVALVATGVPSIAEAKRVGGGKSAGMNRSMPERTAPDTLPAKPTQPPTTQPGAPAGAAAPAAAGTAAAATAGAAAKRSWMGPLAGLAAGLGIAALMSHLGLGEAFGNFLMMALLAVAAIFLVRFLMRRFGAGRQQPALAGAAAGAGAAGVSPAAAWPSQTTERSTLADTPAAAGTSPAFGAGAPAGGRIDPVALPPLNPASAQTLDAAVPAAAAATAAPLAKAFVPAAFDSESFTRTAKMIFIRLQAANDTANLDDLRTFTTPELFASLRLDIQDRGTAVQHTDVQKVDAEVIDVAQEDGQQVVSVRFTGQVVEEKGAAPASFDEVWHLVRPLDDSRPWAIAGIEQMR